MPEFMQPIVDPEIATLSEVLDPNSLAKHLRASAVARRNGGAFEQVQVRVLRHHEHKRCTLEIGLRSQNGWHFMIGKVFHEDRSDVFEAMEGIQRAGFGSQDEFSIPEPLAYLAPLRCLVQEKVEGVAAKEILKTGDERSRIAAAERCAAWLASFHARGPKGGPVSYPQDHLKSKSMRRCARKVGEMSGPSAAKAARLLQRLEDAAAGLSPGELRPCHGSYTAGHVMLSQGRTVVIDWDWHGMADPARDLGRFLYALRRWAMIELGSMRALDGVAEVFLRTYLSSGQPLAERNVRFFEAAACLKSGKRVKEDEHRELAEAMLEEGHRVLEPTEAP